MHSRAWTCAIHFLKDPEGRLSHMKRRGGLEPWRAGWMNLRAMLIHGVNFFLIKPSPVLLALGLLFLIPLAFGPLSLGPLNVSLHTMLLAMAAATVGLSMLFFGGIGAILFDYSDTVRKRLERLLPYNRTFVACILAAVAGVLATVPLVKTYVANHFILPERGIETHWAVMGLWLVIAAFETFIFVLMVRALGMALPARRGALPDAEASFRGDLRLSRQRSGVKSFD
jgi:hypothetical protein